MERFSYPSLAALKAESIELLELIEAESYGYKRDQKEEMDEQIAELERKKSEVNYG
jgi:hypothetical protein